MKPNLVKAAPWLVVLAMFLLWELVCAEIGRASCRERV